MKTSYQILEIENPKLLKKLVALGLRQEVCNIMDIYALAYSIDQVNIFKNDLLTDLNKKK